MARGDLLVVVPWVLFAASVATIGVLVARRRSTTEPGAGRLAGRQQPGAGGCGRPGTGCGRPGTGCGQPGTGDESRPGPASERD